MFWSTPRSILCLIKREKGADVIGGVSLRLSRTLQGSIKGELSPRECKITCRCCQQAPSGCVDGPFVYQIRDCRPSDVTRKRVSSQTLFPPAVPAAHNRACNGTCSRLPRRFARGFSLPNLDPFARPIWLKEEGDGRECARSIFQAHLGFTGNTIRPTGPTPRSDNLHRAKAFEKHCRC